MVAGSPFRQTAELQAISAGSIGCVLNKIPSIIMGPSYHLFCPTVYYYYSARFASKRGTARDNDAVVSTGK